MKLLLDTCVSPRTRDQLALAGHDVIWVGDWESDPGDTEVLNIAEKQSRILVTLDKDFGAGILQISGAEIDKSYVAHWARELNLSDIWNSVLKRIKKDE
jgi:predicted nuclease of predicted toxin-antitoxin system